MDLHQLEIFIVAAQHQSFTEASKIMHMVPSAVSHSMSKLEDQLGVPLFTRSQNKLTLTIYGKHFLTDAYKLTAMARRSIANVQHLLDHKEGSLHLGFVFTGFIDRYLDELTSFYKKYPKVSTVYRQYDSIKITSMLERKELDIAFGREETFSANPNLEWRKLFHNSFVLILRKDHPLAECASVTLAQLKNETIILMDRESNPGMYDMVTHLFMEEGFLPIISSRTNIHQMTILETAIGMGVTITTEQNLSSITLTDNLTTCVIDSPLASHDIGIAWNTESTNPILADFLAEFHIKV